MCIGVLIIELHIPASNSLKHKRMILSSLKGKLRNNFNVSVAEVDGHDKWQKATLAVCQVAKDRVYAHSALQKALHFVESFKGADVVKSEMEML